MGKPLARLGDCESLTFAGVVIPAVPAVLLSRDQEPESRVLKHAKTVRLLPLAI